MTTTTIQATTPTSSASPSPRGARRRGQHRPTTVTTTCSDQQCADGFFRGDFPQQPTRRRPALRRRRVPGHRRHRARRLRWPARPTTPTSHGHVDQGSCVARRRQQQADGSFGGGADRGSERQQHRSRRHGARGSRVRPPPPPSALPGCARTRPPTSANCVYVRHRRPRRVAYDDAARTHRPQAGRRRTPRSTSSVAPPPRRCPRSLWAPAGTGDPHALFTAEYVKAGGKQAGRRQRGRTRARRCARWPGEQSVLGYADANGEAGSRCSIPTKTGTTEVDGRQRGRHVRHASRSTPSARRSCRSAQGARSRKGKKQTVKVRPGLAPGRVGESSSVNGKTRCRAARPTARASSPHVVQGHRQARQGEGHGHVAQFANRKASKTFTVTR